MVIYKCCNKLSLSSYWNLIKIKSISKLLYYYTQIFLLNFPCQFTVHRRYVTLELLFSFLSLNNPKKFFKWILVSWLQKLPFLVNSHGLLSPSANVRLLFFYNSKISMKTAYVLKNFLLFNCLCWFRFHW